MHRTVRFVTIPLLAGLLAFAGVAAAEDGSQRAPFIERLLNEDGRAGCSYAKQAASAGIAPREIADDSLHDYNALHLDIQLTPDIDADSFTGTVEMSAVANEQLTTFFFHLQDCALQSLAVDGEPAEYEHAGEIVTVTPPGVIAAGDTFTVASSYTGTIYSNAAPGGMIYSPGTNTLYTFGEPYLTRRWLACYDLPFDKVTSRMRVTIDDQYYVVSNGLLDSVQENGDGTNTYEWLNDEPTSTYLLSIACGPFVQVDDGPAGVNDTPVSYWVLPEYEDEAAYDFGRTDEMIDYFEPLFGVYPFVKYDQAMTAIFGGWGAMEHQTATTFGVNLANTGTRAYENIVAHELGHQWWGDMVGPRTFANIWLNEGFASYCEALWAEHFSIADRRALLSAFRQQYFNFDDNVRIALYDPPQQYLFAPTIYKKGAWVLHMLRWVVGDEAFFDGLIAYGEEHAYETAVTPEFRQAMEDASGIDLGPFFDEWVYQPGYPEYMFADYQVYSEGDSWTAELRLWQVQEDAPLYSTPLPFHFYGDGADSLVRVDVDAASEQLLVFPGLEFEPDTFLFDPDQWILCTYSTAGVDEQAAPLPESFTLSSAWPNPFNAAASFRVTLRRPLAVRATVHDMLGREIGTVVDAPLRPGSHRLTWTPERGVSSGTYLLRVRAGGETRMRKLVLLK
ncbi:MAG: Aminopeptidase N [Calditrichaeota bacterium]|nr:Aminopeptidase N [Calditrichota bacterium]